MNHRRPVVALGALLLFAATARGDDGFWTTAGGGSWGNGANWDSGTIADGTDNTAFFGTLVNNPANTTVTLDGARTIGNLLFTDQSGADNWILNPGTGGTLTLDNTFEAPNITVALAAQLVTMNAVLAGTNGLEKLGAGTLQLTATNTFTGEAVVSAGTLRVNGRIGGDGVTVAGGSLGGTGVNGA
ncbi:MAG: hypothetical protein EXS35_18090 [Pedosphaera sp.]|nr:hypothetical protein [Pedosphaera sp.]